MCGPNQGEVSAAGQSQATANLLAGNYIQNNGQQQQILNTIRNAMTPVVSAGPEQAGFAGPEAAALNSQAVNNAAASARDVQQAARAGAAGGTALTPAQLNAIQNTSLSSAAGQLAQTQNNNTIASAQVGANRFAGAVTGLNAVAGEENPAAVAGNLVKNQGQTFKMLQSNAQAGAQQFGEIAGGLAGVVSSGAQLSQALHSQEIANAALVSPEQMTQGGLNGPGYIGQTGNANEIYSLGAAPDVESSGFSGSVIPGGS